MLLYLLKMYDFASRQNQQSVDKKCLLWRPSVKGNCSIDRGDPFQHSNHLQQKLVIFILA